MRSDLGASSLLRDVPPDSLAARRASRRRRRRHTRIARTTRTSRRRPHEGRRPSTVPHGAPVAIERIVVAIPARNEAACIASCVTAVDIAAARCPVPVSVVVAADACRDDTAAIVRALPVRHVSVHAVEGRWLGAGPARAAAIDTALARLGGVDASAVWLANTDADCVVAPDWLHRQLEYAVEGAHAVAGIVGLDPSATPTALLVQFAAYYRCSGPTHRHVHAANLGVRADAYTLVGGWSTHTVVGEDHELWRRLHTASLDVRQPTSVSVTTSSRTVGRIHGGFASALARLERIVPQPLSTTGT